MSRIVCTAICESIACPFNLRHDPAMAYGDAECRQSIEALVDALTETLGILSAPLSASAH